MRLWHYKLLKYLPDRQLRGQLRELIAIMRDWRDNGKTNHVLINLVMGYTRNNLRLYFYEYRYAYYLRFGKYPLHDRDYLLEFENFAPNDSYNKWTEQICFRGWHNKDYLRVCMANLYEKHFYGSGRSQLTNEEWNRLLNGYKVITGTDYTL